jgi:hypothetical protein
MPKSNKATMAQRVTDVTRLLVAGAEFSEIHQFASVKGWGLSDRQIRRYVRAAYQQMAKDARRKRTQALGLHLKKRRALYAQSVKANDPRMALQILRDEAKLQGLYSPTEKGPETTVDQIPAATGTMIPIRDRAARQITAELKNDQVELKLLERASNFTTHTIADLDLASFTLNRMTHIYVMEQFEQLAHWFHASWRESATWYAATVWDTITLLSAYRYKVNHKGWMQFAKWLGVDGDDLVAVHCPNVALSQHHDKICASAPTAEELLAQIDEEGLQRPHLVSPEHHARIWREMFCSSFRDRSAI